jgi:Predicted secreted protein
MSLGSSVAIYFIIWWVMLFVVLPFGVRSQQEAGEVSPGSDPGAPARVRIARIVLATSIISLIPFGIFYYFILPMF